MAYTPENLQRIQQAMQRMKQMPAPPDPRFPFPDGPYNPTAQPQEQPLQDYGLTHFDRQRSTGITPPPKMSPIPMPGGGMNGPAPQVAQSTPAPTPTQPANAAPTQSGGAPQSSFGGQDPFGDLPPDVVAQIIGLSDNDIARQQLEEQMMQAQSLRDRPMPQGIHAGRVYVSSNPLAHAGRAFNARRGSKQQEVLRGQQKALGESEVKARQGMWDMIRGRAQRPPQPRMQDVV